MSFFGSLVSAASNVVGGLLGKSSADKATSANMRLQKKAMKEGIQMRVADAKKAGVHPLFALGANVHSPSPVAVADSSLGQGIANAGQDIGNALDAASTGSQRTKRFVAASQALTLDKMRLENELLASEIAKARNNPSFPSPADAFLVPGQGDSGSSPVVREPMRAVAPAPGDPRSEPGAVVEGGFARTSRGWAPIMSKDVQERMEEDFVGKVGYNLRNRIAPMFGVNMQPPNVPLKKGHVWMFDPFYMEYIQVKRPFGTFKRALQ